MEEMTEFKSAKELYDLSKSLKPLRTFNPGIDHILGGPGAVAGKITEIFGEAGSGKTQFCLQLCASVQLPPCIGGLNGKAVYVDTELTFVTNTNRMKQIADVTKKEVTKSLQALVNNKAIPEKVLSEFSGQDMLHNVLVKKVKSVADLLSALTVTDKLMRQENNIKLLIIDSIAYHFRFTEERDHERSQVAQIAEICQMCNKIAVDHGVAVVLTNQVTHKISGDDDSVSVLAPALGNAYSHFIHHRIQLQPYSLRPGHRLATVTKSSIMAEMRNDGQRRQTAFQISESGIRDVEET